MGTFALGEILLLLSYLYIPINVVKESKSIRKFMWFGVAWLIGVIISDTVNETPTVNSIKGMFNVILLLSITPGVFWCIRNNHKAILFYWLGTGASDLISFYFLRSFDSDFEYNVWRVYAYFPVFISIGGYLYYKNHRKAGILLTQSFALWTLFNQSRLIFLTVTLANSILVYSNKLKADKQKSVVCKFRAHSLRLIVLILLSFTVVDGIYEKGANDGYFGESVREKYLMQKNTNMGLASGRHDFFMSAALVFQNPVLGYGSYAEDKNGFREDFLWRHGMDLSVSQDSNMLPGHSYLLGAWVYAGLLGALFFIFVLKIVFKTLKYGNFLYDTRMSAMYLYVTILYVWNILFSPFADRMNFLFIVITLIVLEDYRIKNKKKHDQDFNHRSIV